MARPPVERVFGAIQFEHRFGLWSADGVSHRDGPEVIHAIVLAAAGGRAFAMLAGLGPIAARGVNLCERMIGRAGPRFVPCRLVERVVSLGVATEMAQTEAEMVKRFAVVRIAVPKREPFDGFAKKNSPRRQTRRV